MLFRSIPAEKVPKTPVFAISATSSGLPATRMWVSAAKTKAASTGRMAPPSLRPMTFTFHRLRMSRSMMVWPAQWSGTSSSIMA